MDKYISFDFMEKNRVCTRVEIDGDYVKIKNFVDDIDIRAFGVLINVTLKDVKELFSSRVMPSNRYKCSWLLDKIGVPYYDPYLICRVTNGATLNDYNWIRFDDRKDLTWEQVKYRN